MFKVYDYICNNENCKLDLQVIELLVSDEYLDAQKCELCKGKLRRVLSAVKGYVKGTENPVKQ